MNLPSIKTISIRLNLDRKDAKRIREWMRYAEGLCAYEAQTACGNYVTAHAMPEALTDTMGRWEHGCYNRPTRREIAHGMIAQIITEGRDTSFECFDPQENWPSFNRGPRWEAVNVGDPYVPTVIYRKGRYSIGCWGDLPEVNG